MSDTYDAARPAGSGPLARIGNADLVRGIADCLAVTRAATETTPTGGVYAELAAACARAADAHHWLGDPETGDLADPLAQLRDTAEQVLAEFENVQAPHPAGGRRARRGRRAASPGWYAGCAARRHAEPPRGWPG